MSHQSFGNTFCLLALVSDWRLVTEGWKSLITSLLRLYVHRIAIQDHLAFPPARKSDRHEMFTNRLHVLFLLIVLSLEFGISVWRGHRIASELFKCLNVQKQYLPLVKLGLFTIFTFMAISPQWEMNMIATNCRKSLDNTKSFREKLENQNCDSLHWNL
jgi:hypothetical protein